MSSVNASLSQTDNSWLAAYATWRDGPDVYCKTFLDEAFSLPWCSFHHDVFAAYKSPLRLVEFLAPRGVGKTVLTINGLGSHSILFDPVCTNKGNILIGCKTEPEAVDRTDTIRRELESNEKIKSFFGTMKGDGNWGKEKFDILNQSLRIQCRVQARGVGSALRGVLAGTSRVSKMFLDDLTKKDEAEDPEIGKRHLQWLLMEALPTLDPRWGRAFMLATMVGPYSLASLVSKLPEWYVKFYSIIDEEGQPLWPEMYPLEWIRKTRAAYEAAGDLEGFYLEYMNLPVNLEEGHLNYGDIQYFDDSEVEKIPMFFGISCDPAISEGRGSDASGIVVASITSGGKTLIWECKETRKSNPFDLARMLIDLGKHYKVGAVGIERRGFQMVIKEWLDLKAKEEGLPFEIVGTMGGNEKDAKAIRIKKLITEIKNGNVFFRKNGDGVNHLVDRLISYGRGRGNHDDLEDAAALLPQVLKAPESVNVVRKTAVQLEIEQLKKRTRAGYELLAQKFL